MSRNLFYVGHLLLGVDLPLSVVNIIPVKQTNFSCARKYQLQIAFSLGMRACVYFPILSALGCIKFEPVQALFTLAHVCDSPLASGRPCVFGIIHSLSLWLLQFFHFFLQSSLGLACVCGGDGVGRLGTWWRQPMSDWVFKSCNIFDSIKCIIIVDFHEPWSCLMDKMIGTGRLWNTIAVIWWRTSN